MSKNWAGLEAQAMPCSEVVSEDASLWDVMNERYRRPVSSLSEAAIPSGPGVYALYYDGKPVYVGKAAALRSRVWRNHLRQGVSMTNSALRRNVANFLDIASAADIKARRYQPTAVDAKRVSEWIQSAELAWIECDSEADALALEAAMKAEWMPPLTVR